jgi:hypothetical protein
MLWMARAVSMKVVCALAAASIISSCLCRNAR